MVKLLFVCHSNRCRSVLAQGLFEHYLDTQGIDTFTVDSAGIAVDTPGKLADTAVQKYFKAQKIAFQHAARPLQIHDFLFFDGLMALDHSTFASLKAQAPAALLDKIYPLMRFSSLSDREVCDPYAGFDSFDAAITQIESTFSGLLQHFLKNTA